MGLVIAAHFMKQARETGQVRSLSLGLCLEELSTLHLTLAFSCSYPSLCPFHPEPSVGPFSLPPPQGRVMCSHAMIRKVEQGDLKLLGLGMIISPVGNCVPTLPLFPTQQSAERCVSTLLDLIQTKVNYVVQEAIVVIKDIFRKYPNK